MLGVSLVSRIETSFAIQFISFTRPFPVIFFYWCLRAMCWRNSWMIAWTFRSFSATSFLKMDPWRVAVVVLFPFWHKHFLKWNQAFTSSCTLRKRRGTSRAFWTPSAGFTSSFSVLGTFSFVFVCTVVLESARIHSWAWPFWSRLRQYPC